MTPVEADALVDASAAYVHVPFCSAVCPYCDFAVVADRADDVERYVEAIVTEIDQTAPWRSLDAVYFGGGTPSRVAPELLVTIIEALANRHGLAGDAEISLEANPEDFNAGRAKSFARAGFNRVSFGAQSFDETVLSFLGRRHGPEEIRRSVDAARVGGFENISVDLIYGTPGESAGSWLKSAQAAIDLDVPHVSAYALTVERGTPLSRAVAGGAASPDPDIQADRYEVIDRMLTTAGLLRYEVSNWARSGYECRYNLTVWAQGEYLAYGNGAHGFRDGERFRNVRRLDAYLDRVEAGVSPRSGSESVADWQAEIDRVFVGLRRSVGVAVGDGTRALTGSTDGQSLLENGVLAETDGRLVVRKPLLTDMVHRSVLGLPAPIVIGHGDA